MNFREEIVNLIATLLNALKIDDKSVQQGPPSDLLYLTPNADFFSALRAIVVEPIETTTGTDIPTITRVAPEPVAYISFNESQNNNNPNEGLIGYWLETLGVRIDIVLNKKVGVRLQDQERVKSITYQISDLLDDIQKIINLSALQPTITSAVIHSVTLQTWQAEQSFLGGQLQVLNLNYDISVSYKHEV